MKFPTIVFATLLSASSAFAREATPAASPTPKKPMTAEEMMKRYDKNNDGAVTLEEYSAMSKDKEQAKAMFLRRDKNADGKLTVEEIAGKPKAAKEDPAAKKE